MTILNLCFDLLYLGQGIGHPCEKVFINKNTPTNWGSVTWKILEENHHKVYDLNYGNDCGSSGSYEHTNGR